MPRSAIPKQINELKIVRIILRKLEKKERARIHKNSTFRVMAKPKVLKRSD
jgi:hypothetical protein